MKRTAGHWAIEVIGCMLVFTVGIVAVCTTAIMVRAALAVWGLAQ